jgi:hypothetical protein
MVGHFLLRIATRVLQLYSFPGHHWKEIQKSETLTKLFPEPPVVAFRRPKSIKNTLVRAAVSRPSSTVGQVDLFFFVFQEVMSVNFTGL